MLHGMEVKFDGYGRRTGRRSVQWGVDKLDKVDMMMNQHLNIEPFCIACPDSRIESTDVVELSRWCGM